MPFTHRKIMTNGNSNPIFIQWNETFCKYIPNAYWCFFSKAWLIFFCKKSFKVYKYNSAVQGGLLIKFLFFKFQNNFILASLYPIIVSDPLEVNFYSLEADTG